MSNVLTPLDDIAASLANIAELRRRGADHCASSRHAIGNGARVLNGLSVGSVADVVGALEAVEQAFAEQVADIEATPAVCDGCGNARRPSAVVDGLCSRCS